MRRYSMVLMACTTTVFTLVLVPVAAAQEFMLQVGFPIAGNAQQAKSSLLVVRPGGCANPASAHFTATAEGIVDGARRTLPLTLTALPTPGVHAVPKEWARRGVWIVNLVGTCAGRTAGAIVPVGPKATFSRDAVKLFAHRPTLADIDASLKALTGGAQQ